MNRKLSRTLGLTLLTLAIGAVAAQSAMATELGEKEGETETYPLTVTGERIGNHVFTFTAGTFKCATANFIGELPKASPELTLSAEYPKGSCTLGGINAEVNMTSCDFLLTTGAKIALDEYSGSMHIKCTKAGDTIDITVPSTGCTVAVPVQTLGGLTFTDKTTAMPKRDIELHTKITGIQYSQSATCFHGVANLKDGTYTAVSTLRAFKGGNQVGLEVR